MPFRYPQEIEYTYKYYDSIYEYRHVILPRRIAKDLVRLRHKSNNMNRLLTEDDWRGLGICQSRGWENYEVHRPEPHILLFRRPIGTDPVSGKPSSHKVLTITTTPLTDGNFFVWTIPARRLQSAAKGDRMQSKSFQLQGASGKFRLHYYPKGEAGASTSMCSAYVWTENAATMQMLVCANEVCKCIGTEGCAEWKARDRQGYTDFCLQPEGDVTLMVVLLQNDTHAIPWTFNVRLACTNMAGEEAANFDCEANALSASLYSRIAGIVSIAPECLKLIRPNGDLLPGARENTSDRPLLAGIVHMLAPQRMQHGQFGELKKEVLFQVGQRVECRDGEGRWKRGVVHSLDPLRIHPDGYKSAYKYREVRKIEKLGETIVQHTRDMGEIVHPIATTVSEEPVGPDEQSVTEYVADIRALYFRDQKKFLPRGDYMDMQTDINSKMRCILVDWMIEVLLKLGTRSETLHLSISITDRYLSQAITTRKRLQLVGVVAMFIASKFEEENPHPIHDWVYWTDHAYTKDDVHYMECQILTTLGFRIVVPTAVQFFVFLLNVNDCDEVQRALAQYILELGLLDIRMLQYPPSHVASSALNLSNQLLGREISWPATMAQESGHTEAVLADCVGVLKQVLEWDQNGSQPWQTNGSQLKAVYKKFSQASHHGVARKLSHDLRSACN